MNPELKMSETAEGEPQSVQSVADISTFVAYIRRVVPVLLEDDDPDLRSLQKAVQDKNNIEIVKKFLSDVQTPALLVQRVAIKGMAVCLFRTPLKDASPPPRYDDDSL